MSGTPEIGSRLRTNAIINRYHLSAKKGLGQNFLVDLPVLRNIVKSAGITKEDNVIEIGPGIGALTEQLAKSSKSVLAFEIDESLLPVLDETLAPYSNVKIINQDFLQANVPELIKEYFGDKKTKIVANLPYYITKPILLDILKGNIPYESAMLMMQKEVGERLAAEPKTKAYGSLTVVAQYLDNVHLALNVSSKSFFPSPKVDSVVVNLTPKTNREVYAFDDKKFFGFVRGCFMHKRKTIYNNLQGIFGRSDDIREQILDVIAELNIQKSDRPEQLTVNQFVRLANKFHEAKLLV